METIVFRHIRLFLSYRPHSLGTLIEWKLESSKQICCLLQQQGPHSLGTLIEWKLKNSIVPASKDSSPHSLGTLIEWKHPHKGQRGAEYLFVPTRWGH